MVLFCIYQAEVNMRFTKMHGTGNDFVIIEAKENAHNWSDLAIKMCDRHFGIGADGILVMSPSDKADFKWRIFNSDGSESETCGNGLRCSTKYFLESNHSLAVKDIVSIETITGITSATYMLKEGKVNSVKVSMGVPKFSAQEIPVNLAPNSRYVGQMLVQPLAVADTKLALNLVSMGNPHAVHFTQNKVTDFPLSEIGPQVEHHSMFPRRTNFEIANVIRKGVIEVRVWERGVGETLACGSGACAVAVAAKLNGLTDDITRINLPGGTLEIDWNGTDKVFLTGHAETVFTGEWLSE